MKIIYRDGADAETGTIQFCSWSRAQDLLRSAASCRRNESIEAINITKEGLEFFLCQNSEMPPMPPKVKVIP